MMHVFNIECINNLSGSDPARQAPLEYKGSYQTNESLKSTRQASPASQSTEKIRGKIEKIPRSKEAVLGDNKLIEVQCFLENRQVKLSDSVKDIKEFTKYASEFFVLDDKLWWKDCHRRHKIVIPKEKGLDLVRQAHNKLGHKGIFTTQIQLCERLFWWPHMDEDIRWYTWTCHECQVCITKKIITLPVDA